MCFQFWQKNQALCAGKGQNILNRFFFVDFFCVITMVNNGNLDAVNGNVGPVNCNFSAMKKTVICYYFRQIVIF